MRFAAHFLGLIALASPASQIYSLTWSPDGATIALGGYKETRLVNSQTKKTVVTLTGSAEAVRAVAFSHDGKLLAAAGGLPARKGEVKIWDLSTQTVKTSIAGHSDCIYAVAFSPDGASLATASYDKLIKLWDASTGKEIRTFHDHVDSIYALAFTADGKRLVSGAADRSVKIWDVATGARLYTLSDPTDGINTIARRRSDGGPYTGESARLGLRTRILTRREIAGSRLVQRGPGNLRGRTCECPGC
jgi:WD40 repeat protein